MKLFKFLEGLIRWVDAWMFRKYLVHDSESFEQAKLRLNLRITWIFVIAGAVYSASFLHGNKYFVVFFGVGLSASLIFLPITIKYQFPRLRKIIFFLAASIFVTVNILGSGNGISVPIVLWMVLVVQLANAILTAESAIVTALLITTMYIVKWFCIQSGYSFPYLLPYETVETPRLIDIAAPVFYNISLTFNSFRFATWARQQIATSKETVASLNRVLADTEERNDLIVEQSLGFISMHDAEGVILFINNAAARTLGYLPSELVGRSIGDVMEPKSRAVLPKYLNVIMKRGAAEGIMRAWTKEGDVLLWFYRNALVVDAHGAVTILCFAHDVTELERTHRQLEKARLKAEESDRLKSLFLANISHEFRTPLNAILGFSELIEKSDLSQERRREFTRHIRERSLNLLGMLNNLLDFSRIEAGHVTLQEINGDIDEMMEKIVSDFSVEATYLTNRRISIEKVNKLPIATHGRRLDFFKLNQVLINLISNAVKFTSKGHIYLVCEETEPGILLFSVSDTGDGIPKEKLETIFRPFRQANDTIQRKYGGSGLGLAICKGLVESWKGTIWVESTLGVGSIFKFTVPAADVKTQSSVRQSF